MRSLLFIGLISFFFSAANAQTLNLLPDIPEPATNTHLATAFSGVKTGVTTFSASITQSDELLLAAMAYLHPSSPYKNQQAVLNRLTLLLDSTLGAWDSGKLPLNDMMFSFHAAVSYLMLKQYQPSAIPSGKKAIWESGIRKNIDAVVAGSPNLYANKIIGSIWLNGDLRRAMGVYFGALALGDNTLAADTKAVIEGVMTKTLLPDGGTHYVGYDTESPSYHGEITMRGFLWYYILTKSQLVKDFICATNNYIPLMQIPIGNGFKEWISCPAAKAYYNQTTLKPEALAKAYLNGDSYNYEIGKGSQNLYLAFLYRSGLTGVVVPDNYMLFDRNHIGPRGRWGNWGVIGKIRDPSNPAPELNETPLLPFDGTNTFVGAFSLDANANSTTYPLSAAFQGAAPQVKFASGVETDWQRGNKWALLTGSTCYNAITKSHTVYGLSTSYSISKKRFVSVGWNAQQQWVVTPDRVIGMIEMESSATSSIYGLAQRIQLVSGRAGATGGTRKILNIIDPNTYEYGYIRLKIIDKSYLGVVDTIYHGVFNGVGDNFSVMVLLNDAKSGSDVLTGYSKGVRRYAFFEVTNKDRSYSTNATRLTLAAGLEGFEFQESAGRKVRMIHNITNSPITLASSAMPSPYSKTRMLKSWDETSVNALTVASNSTTLPTTVLPANSHVVIVNSNLVDDHTLGYSVYADVFTQGATAISDPTINIFPAIVVDKDKLHIPSLVIDKPAYLSIYTLQGALISTRKLTPQPTPIDISLSDLRKGIYFLELCTPNGRVVEKFVKQ
ncbi:MAG: T9SS type A sorting domain-containing protein [Bacteroidales bacterium]